MMGQYSGGVRMSHSENPRFISLSEMTLDWGLANFGLLPVLQKLSIEHAHSFIMCWLLLFLHYKRSVELLPGSSQKEFTSSFSRWQTGKCYRRVSLYPNQDPLPELASPLSPVTGFRWLGQAQCWAWNRGTNKTNISCWQLQWGCTPNGQGPPQPAIDTKDPSPTNATYNL